jgi:hypothetical protein
MTSDSPEYADDAERRAFAASFRAFLDWVHSEWRGTGPPNEVAELVTNFLGPAATTQSVVARPIPVFDHVNLQTALDAWSADAGRSVEVHGITIPPHHGSVTLQQLIGGDSLPPLRLSAPSLIDLPNGPTSTLACLLLAVLLVSDSRGQYVLMVIGPSEHDQSLTVEIGGLAVADAQAVHAELDALRNRLNVYRGHVLDVTANPHGGVAISFAGLALTPREAVVLPEAVLERVERHTLGVAAHRLALRAAHQHLKRGLLLYGPPGTGKTHTTRYLLGQLDGYTRLILTGRALMAIGSAAELARDLQPAALVLEDVDLVAEDRSFGPGSSPILFDLLDAMDGAAADADLLFILTTNRADLLEPALAARPGRVDVAVEIDLPEAEARRRLLRLYGAAVPLRLTAGEEDTIVERTDGVTASFLKELLRRAVLEALQESGRLEEVTAEHCGRALDDLLESGQRVTRSLLGVGNDPEQLPPGGGAGGLGPPGHPRPGVFYAGGGRRGSMRYRG